MLRRNGIAIRERRLRASKLIGTTVQNDANESIGKINEVILGKDGKVAAVVVGVGGFLGMGEREVALNYDALRLTQDSNGKFRVVFNATKELVEGCAGVDVVIRRSLQHERDKLRSFAPTDEVTRSSDRRPIHGSASISRRDQRRRQWLRPPFIPTTS